MLFIISKESRFIKFSLLILLTIISLICSLCIIYNIIKYPSIRKRFHNQTLIILVIIVLSNILFNVPATLSYFARGHVMFDNDSFCLGWQIVDYTYTACIIWCKAIFTLERYILVFYPNNFRRQRQKLLFHYIPLIVINIYLIIFYILINVLCPWDYDSNFSKHLCGTQCLDQLNGVATFNWIFNILFPAFIIIFGSIFLLLKVLWKRREMQRNLRNWSKNWKMLIQLLGIAIIYIIIWIPLSIISIISMFNKFDSEHENIADHFYFLTYICELTVPIIALVFWPEIMQKLRARFRSNSIVSITMGGQSTN